MEKSSKVYVGMDVHKESIEVTQRSQWRARASATGACQVSLSIAWL